MNRFVHILEDGGEMKYRLKEDAMSKDLKIGPARFVNGEYETDDSEHQSFLDQHPLVEKVDVVKKNVKKKMLEEGGE